MLRAILLIIAVVGCLVLAGISLAKTYDIKDASFFVMVVALVLLAPIGASEADSDDDDDNDYDSTICPSCDSKNTNAFEFNVERMHRPHSCNDCKATWVDIYEPVAYDDLVKPLKPEDDREQA